jgi:quinol-cytochrome oxidoreductase complex cytochrome b subunit
MSDNSDAISDWSKWVIGLSLFSASGCLSVLLSVGVKKANIINIKMAILFFLLTILIAWIVQFIIALRKNYDSNKSNSENEILFFSYSTLRKLLRTFIVLEMITFIISLFFLTVWIMKLPAKDETSPSTTLHSFNKTNLMIREDIVEVSDTTKA